jgi:hypothetical protein
MSVCLEKERLQLRYMKAVDLWSGNVRELEPLHFRAYQQQLRICKESRLAIDSARTEVEKHRERCGC